jgi:hypothetical protein
VPARPQYSAENIPFDARLIFITRDGRKLCAKDAERYVQHMTREKVNGYTHSEKEICDACGTVLSA